MVDIADEVVPVARVDRPDEHDVREDEDQVARVVLARLGTRSDLVVIEDPHRHRGIVEEHVQDERRDPDEERAKHRGHPENSLEVQAPNHEL